MYILGINAVYPDPAAGLVKDGRVIEAAEEEQKKRSLQSSDDLL